MPTERCIFCSFLDQLKPLLALLRSNEVAAHHRIGVISIAWHTRCLITGFKRTRAALVASCWVANHAMVVVTAVVDVGSIHFVVGHTKVCLLLFTYRLDYYYCCHAILDIRGVVTHTLLHGCWCRQVLFKNGFRNWHGFDDAARKTSLEGLVVNYSNVWSIMCENVDISLYEMLDH